MKHRAGALIVTILLFSSATASAAECKYKKNEADPFTKEKIVLTKWKPFRPTGNEAVNHGWMAGEIEHGKNSWRYELAWSDTTGNRPSRKAASCSY
jgi:hypothetical protein